MPGLAQRNDQFISGSSATYSLSANGFWSKHHDDVSFNQLQKFWCELPTQARQELLRIDKQTLFEEARKNMYCSRCNGLLLEGFLQIVMYGKSLQQERAGESLLCNRLGVLKNQNKDGSNIVSGHQDEIQDPSVHPWGGLTTTRDGSLTLMDCYLYSKSLLGLQSVFDSARARERERELLYPDACGGGGRGWISQGMASYGRGHGTRETCALHTARLSCDTLVDFWSALGEETRQSLLRMKEEDFIERLMYRFDSKRFCRDCRRNVIREFKELKELKRMRRETRCTSWFCVADTAFLCEVSDETVQADWSQTFADTLGTYHHFEWAVGTGEGKSDILEFENVGVKGNVRVNGLGLTGLSSCFITLRAWKLDGRCTELSVKAHALKGQQCVHCRLVIGDGFVTITKGDSVRRFFEHAEEAEEEEDDDTMDKDGNELDGECSRPQKHAKSPELAREFLLDAATVIFKEQVEKAFREGTARQNAHSIFVCLAIKLLEERVHVACKEIITLEKQMKLLEEEEKEKREEEERKERRRTKEREKKLRRKERLKGKEKDKDKKCPESTQTCVLPDVQKEDSSPSVHEDPNSSISCKDSVCEAGDATLYRLGSPNSPHDQCVNECDTSRMLNLCCDCPDGEITCVKDGCRSFIVEHATFSRRRPKFRKEVQQDQSLKWSDRRRIPVVSETSASVGRLEPKYYADNYDTRILNGANRQLRPNATKSSCRHGPKFNGKYYCNFRITDRYDFNSCSCNQNSEYRAKVEPYAFKSASKSESALNMAKQVYHVNRLSQVDNVRDNCGRNKSKVIPGNNTSGKDLLHLKKVWEPMESQKRYPRSNSDSDIRLRSSSFKVGVEPENGLIKSPGDMRAKEVSEHLGEVDEEDNNVKSSTKYDIEMDEGCQKGHNMGSKNQNNLTKEAFQEESSCPNNPTLKNSTLSASNGTSNLVGGSAFSSDHCSSCLSEGDSNSASSNHRNLESSSTSDSEDASIQSEGRETSVCISQNDSSECHEVWAEKSNGEDTFGETMHSGYPQDGMRSNVFGNTFPKLAKNFNSGFSTVSLGSSNQGMIPVPPMHNHNLHYPVFQAPPTMGYYHQNPVSWPAPSTNGLMPFPHPGHGLYGGPLGCGANGNSCFGLQYGPLQHLTTPIFHPAQVPIYHSVSKTSAISKEERPHISKVGAVSEGSNEVKRERVIPGGLRPTGAQPIRESKENDSSTKLQTDGSTFSLFHFGGPVGLSTESKSNPMMLSQEGRVGVFSTNYPADHVEGDHAFSKKETIMEEYNLFAASNGLRFSFF